MDSAAPQYGQSATIELHSVSDLLHNQSAGGKERKFAKLYFYFIFIVNIAEYAAYPGPLVVGETHKNDVIKFCERKIVLARDTEEMADRDSYILLWEMLILLLRQKGQCEGSDLADLLLKVNRRLSGWAHWATQTHEKMGNRV